MLLGDGRKLVNWAPKKEGRKIENQGKRKKWGRRKKKRKGSGGDPHVARAEGKRGKR